MMFSYKRGNPSQWGNESSGSMHACVKQRHAWKHC